MTIIEDVEIAILKYATTTTEWFPVLERWSEIAYQLENKGHIEVRSERNPGKIFLRQTQKGTDLYTERLATLRRQT